MEELTQNNRIEGTVTAILFRNEENGYTVLRLDGGERGEITAVGSMPGVSRGRLWSWREAGAGTLLMGSSLRPR